MRIPPVSDEHQGGESTELKMPPKFAALVKLLTSVGSIASDFEGVEFRFVLYIYIFYLGCNISILVILFVTLICLFVIFYLEFLIKKLVRLFTCLQLQTVGY